MEKRDIRITAPNFQYITLKIIGTAPLLQLRMTEKAENAMLEKMAAGPQAKKGKAREARNYDEEYTQAAYKSKEGWFGFNAAALRLACIRVCSLVDFKMTLAKMSIFVEAEGFDVRDGTPLVRILGTPVKDVRAVTNASGVKDFRVRARWDTWSAKVRIRFDADQFSAEDVTNLISRVGLQNGLGEGRPFSKMSAGMDFGLFQIERTKTKAKK
jgi:hypothetical protein